MKVSVLITTYNQEGFIAQAVASALMQTVDFPYEIVIGEDASTDRTRDIVQEFERKYPDKIRVLLQDLPAAERDRAAGLGGKTGFVKCLEACRGQYIALLDGDDYWTDTRKLQKQVDFLGRHSTFSMCFHNAKVLRQDHEEVETFCSAGQKEVSTIEDLIAGNFIHAGSSMFRRGLFGALPDWFRTTKSGDWALHLLNARHGDIRYLSEDMGVYRVHNDAFWSSRAPTDRVLDAVALLGNLNAYLEFKYNRQIKDAQCKHYDTLTNIYYSDGDLTKARHFLAKRICLGLSNYSLPSKQQVGRLFKLKYPGLYNFLRSLQNFISSVRL